ncbi:MAG: hypothetical protein L0241_09335 [Planctomycetia bacterium]|nr:hypothetical protein [Planctomycetia bacterium]
MARTAIGVVILSMTVAVVIGCGPAKELPDEVPKHDGPAVEAPLPDKSDPAAEEVVKRAVKAFTGGKPELLVKGKVSRNTVKGVTLQIATEQQPKEFVESERHLTAVWPDRVHFSYDLTGNANRASWLFRPSLHVRRNNLPIPMPSEYEKIITSDVLGQHWLPLIFPLTDEKAKPVVFDLKSVVVERQVDNKRVDVQANVLAVGFHGMEDMPQYQLTFDAKTDSLIGVDYKHDEVAQVIRHRLVLTDHKMIDGLLLPNKMEYVRNGEEVERWVVEKWEFPATIDNKEFIPPKN